MSLQFQPMPLQKRRSAFDDPDWIFELKYDGFRALAVIEHGRAQLISRNGHPFASFADLAKDIAASIPSTKLAVLDGEIVCVDKKGKPQFRDLLFCRGNPCFFAFDLLTRDGKDWRMERLMDRKQELRRLLSKISPPFPLRYVDHVDGRRCFSECSNWTWRASSPSTSLGLASQNVSRATWVKILNREYSQMAGREELFERDRHREPVAGWHSCELACENLDPRI